MYLKKAYFCSTLKRNFDYFKAWNSAYTSWFCKLSLATPEKKVENEGKEKKVLNKIVFQQQWKIRWAKKICSD